MGYFNSNKSRFTSRGNKRSYASMNRRMLRSMTYDNTTHRYKEVEEEVYVTKKQAEAIDLGFLGYSLKYGDVIIIGDPSDMLPLQYVEDHNIVRNHVFTNIKADKIGLMYSSKLKQFLYLVLNDDYTIAILDRFDQPPINEKIDLENLHPRIELKERANRILLSVYYHSEVLDLTQNPIIHFKSTEVFKR